MCQYILDTDSVSLILRNHPRIIVRAEQHRFAITIITIQEQFNGWVPKINQVRDTDDMVRLTELYTYFLENVQFYQNQTILNFTPDAAFSNSYSETIAHCGKQRYKKICELPRSRCQLAPPSSLVTDGISVKSPD